MKGGKGGQLGKKSLGLQHSSEKVFTRLMGSPGEGCLLKESHMGTERASAGTFAVGTTGGKPGPSMSILLDPKGWQTGSLQQVLLKEI